MYSFSLKYKTILITGASSGIGRACAIAADKMGASLLLFGRDKTRLKETVHLLQIPQNHQSFAIDLTDFRKVEELFSEFQEKKIKIHGLINAAGISTTLPLKRSKPDKISQYVETNVSSAIHLSQLCAQKVFLDEHGSSIIFIASVLGMVFPREW